MAKLAPYEKTWEERYQELLTEAKRVWKAKQAALTRQTLRDNLAKLSVQI